MKHIVLQKPDGSSRVFKIGEFFKKAPDETISVQDRPETIMVVSRPPIIKGPGDLIARATSAIGIKPCGGCKKRQEDWNRKWSRLVKMVKKS